jgi:transcription antitermination factor NusG
MHNVLQLRGGLSSREGEMYKLSETGHPTVVSSVAVAKHWTVAHTRPRAEKRLADHCDRLNIVYRLPLRRSVRRYDGRTVVFKCPMFPGYVFLESEVNEAQPLFATGHLARLLSVQTFQALELEQQLNSIETALRHDVDLEFCPEIRSGIQVRIRYGVLRGTLAWVQERRGQTEVILRIDFIGQAAVLRLEADALEPV